MWSCVCLNASEKKLDVLASNKIIKSERGKTIKIEFEAINNTKSDLFLRNITRLGNEVLMNRVPINDGDNLVISSSLSGSYPTGVNPHKPIRIKPNQKQKFYVRWDVTGKALLTFRFSETFTDSKPTVSILISNPKVEQDAAPNR
jgi:hypothetical protein